MGRPTVGEWAAHKSMNPFAWLWFVFRSTWLFFVVDNPLSWMLGLRGAVNQFDDIEGPFFIQGAPIRQVDEGQAVLATTELLNKADPYLVLLEVRDTKGEPVKNAMIDTWQADGTGAYYFFSWTLRGKMTTDAKGRLELLTIRPREYAGRASHIHIRIYPADKRHRQMTSQMYMCDGNDPVHMSSSSDIANKWRRRPDGNMVTCWATEGPKDGKTYHDLPKLPEEDVDMMEAVSRWNAKLKEQGVTKKIMSVGRHQVKITTY